MIRKILFGSFANLFSIVVVMAAGLVRSALAVRYLVPAEAGVWFLFLNVITLISFCDFGLSPTLSREIGFAFKKKNAAVRISNLFVTVRALVNFVSLISVFLLSCFGFFYLRHLPLDVQLMKHVLYAFVIFSMGIVIQFQANPYLAVIYGVGNVATERYIRAIGPLLGTLLSAVFVIKFHSGLYGLVAGYFGQTFIIYIVSRGFLRKSVKLSQNRQFLPVIFRRILEPSLQWAIMSIGATLIFQTSNLIIAYLLGVQFVAQFAILLQIFTLIMTLAGIVGYVITPLIAQAKSRHDYTQIHYYFSLSARSSTAIAIVLAIFVYFFIRPIVQIWLGHDFVVNQNALLILLTVSVLEAHHVSCAIVAMATGYVKFAAIAMIGGILNLILSFIFIHYWGILGGALAIFISQLLTNNWYAVLIPIKILQYPLKSYVLNVILPLLIFFIYVELAVCVTSNIINLRNQYLHLLVAIIAVCMLVFVGAWLFLLSGKEKQTMKAKILEVI